MPIDRNYVTSLQRYLLPLIAVSVTLVFIQAAWNDFVDLDDPLIVSSNANVWSGLTFQGIRWAFTSDVASNWVPLTMVSHMLDVQLFGMNPSGHHLVNLMFHVGSTVTLFLFFHRATHSPYKSAAVALFYALHPMQVEPVAWIAERKDVLSAFFWMLTMYLYLIYSEKRMWGRYLATLAIFILALLAKPMVVTLPLVLLLLDWWPLGRLGAGAPNHRPFSWLIVEKIPFVILSAAVSVITFMLKNASGEIVTEYSFWERVCRACVLYWKYVYKVLLPVNLAVFYPGTDAPPDHFVPIVAAIAIVSCVVTVLALSPKYPYLATGWLWFLVALLPVIGIVQNGACTFADRYVYLPSVGLAIILVWGIGGLPERLNCSNMYVFGGFVFLFLAMIPDTEVQLLHWRNSFTLLSHAIEVTQDNWLALNNLGQEYLNAGKVDDAIWYFKQSVKAKPTYVIAWTNLAAVLLIRNRRDEAVEALQQALQLEPNNTRVQLLMQSLSR